MIFLLYKKFLQLEITKQYYVGLAVQARFLYRQSTLFKDRWQQIGLKFAEETFENTETGEYFFHKAQKEPFMIRFQIFLDTITGKEPTAYYL